MNISNFMYLTNKTQPVELLIVTLFTLLLFFTVFVGRFLYKKTQHGYNFESLSPKTLEVAKKPPLGVMDPSLPMSERQLIEEIFFASHRSVDEKYVDRCIELLKRNPEAVNFRLEPSGYTPFLDACWAGSRKLVRYMLQHGADVNSTAEDGITAMYLAAYSYSRQEARGPAFDPSLLDALLRCGADVNQPRECGGSPLHVAAKIGDFELVRWLLVHRADAEALTSVAMTPADLARKHGHTRVAEFLTVQVTPRPAHSSPRLSLEFSEKCEPKPRQRCFVHDEEGSHTSHL